MVFKENYTLLGLVGLLLWGLMNCYNGANTSNQGWRKSSFVI
jgi:hypothetical protein